MAIESDVVAHAHARARALEMTRSARIGVTGGDGSTALGEGGLDMTLWVLRAVSRPLARSHGERAMTEVATTTLCECVRL